MSNSNDIWFKPKPYPHFSSKISNRDKNWLLPFLKSTDRIAAHAFFPFILRTVQTRRFRKPREADCTVTRRSLKRVQSNKARLIHYATHLDAHIYAYYANLLNDLYENRLKREPGLSACILSYRRIEIPYKPQRNKCNIEFAFETFAEIKRRGESCTVLTFDIKSFFDTLRHDLLKKAWCDLLETDTLPEDHYSIFKAITKFRYVKESDILRTLNLRENDLREWKKNKLFTLEEFRQIITTTLLPVERHEVEEGGKFKGKGIPQGTPISAFLSNLYMLEFDRYMYHLVVEQHNGIYRRYSDDIIVALYGNRSLGDFVEDQVTKKIFEDLKLEIQPDKTECFFFEQVDEGLKIKGNKPLTYLGFEFDGDRVLVKGASLAKYYRTVKQIIKHSAWRASARKPVESHKALKVFRNRVYRHSHLFKKNYVAYMNRADEAAVIILGDHRHLIRKQIRNHWKFIYRELLKREVHVNRVH